MTDKMRAKIHSKRKINLTYKKSKRIRKQSKRNRKQSNRSKRIRKQSKRIRKQSKRNRKQSKRNRKIKTQKKLRLAHKGGAGMLTRLWEITRDDAKRLINSNTNVEEGEVPDFENLIGQLMALRLNDATIEYQTYEQILEDELAHFESRFGAGEEEYIARMRQVTQHGNEDYTDEHEREDRDNRQNNLENAINRVNTYRNDLHNYARALLINWQESGREGNLL